MKSFPAATIPTAVSAVLMVTIVLISPMIAPCDGTATPAPPRGNLTICFQIPTDGRAAGFSLDQIVAIRRADETIGALYANDTTARIAFRTKTKLYQSNQFVPNSTANMIRLIEKEGCNAIVSTGQRMWNALTNGSIDQLSAMYPAVRFLLHADFPIKVSHPNAHYTILDGHQERFALGAAAAVACSSCVGFLIAVSPPAVVTSFNRGMKFGEQFRSDGANVTALCPVLAFFMVNTTDVDTEVAFTRAMHTRGCSILVYHTVAAHGARIVQQQQLKTSANTPVFSITMAQDGALFIGDTVLTSFYTSYDGAFVRYIQSYFTQTPFVSGINPDGAKIGCVSPLAAYNVTTAMEAAAAAYARSNGTLVRCTPIYNQQGVLFNPVVNGTVQCIPLTLYVAMATIERGLAVHPNVRPPAVCPAGTYASYDAFVNLTLTCIACPGGAYTSAPGQLACRPCPAGTAPNPERTACKPLPTAGTGGSGDTSTMVLLLAVLLPCAVLVLGFLAWAAHRRLAQQATVVPPPPGGDAVAVAVIQVDGNRSSKNWRKRLHAGDYVFELLRHSVNAAAERHGVYIAPSTPWAYVIVAEAPEQLVEVAEDVEQALVSHSDAFTTCFISINGIVLVGPAFPRESKSATNKVKYVGPAMRDAMMLAQAATQSEKYSGLSCPVSLFNRLAAADPSLKARFMTTYTVSADDPDDASTKLRIEAAAMRFRFIPAPGQREAIASGDARPTDDRLTGSTTSLVVQRGQKETLRAMFHSIASLFLFTMSPAKQEETATWLASRFRIYLPAAGQHKKAARTTQQPQQPPHPGAAGAGAAAAAAGGKQQQHRNEGLHTMIKYVTPFVLDDMDELSVRDHILAMDLATGPTLSVRQSETREN